VRPKARPTGDERRRLARLKEVESRIAALEEELARLSLSLENPPADPKAVQQLGEDYVAVQNEINALLAEWEQMAERSYMKG
jgi:uncharacterized small protein (DUF1192 family)